MQIFKWALALFIFTLGLLFAVQAADIHSIGPGTTDVTAAEHSPCAKVIHDGVGTSLSYFVGAKTQTEWQSFYDDAKGGGLSGITISGCP